MFPVTVVQADEAQVGDRPQLKLAQPRAQLLVAAFGNTRSAAISYATSGRVISGDRTCNSRLGPVRGTVLHVAAAVLASASTTS